MSSYRRILRHPDFRYLFLGQAASAIGDQVVIVALALFITRKTGSPTDLGLVLAAQSLPMIALMLLGGVWADRLPRQKIMLATDAIRAGLHLAVAILIFTGSITILELVLIEAAFGACRAFFQPAYTGLVPQTVPESLILDATALTSSTYNLAALIGPALSTALVLGLGAGEAFLFDAATFVVSAVLLVRVRARVRGELPEAAASGSVLRELRDGWRETVSRPWVWVTIACFTGMVLALYTQWYALAPIVARNSYGSVGVFGVLESVAGGGAVLGALVAIRWRPVRPLLAGLFLCLPWPLMAASFALHAPLAVVVCLMLALGFGFSLFGIWWETSLARYIPPHALSRVSSYDWVGSLALLPVGFAVAGPLAGALGARTVLEIGSAVAVVLLGVALLPRSTRNLGAEQLEGEVAVEPGRVGEIAHVDPLIGVMHERRFVEQAHVPVRKEAVGDAIGERLTEPTRVREPRE
jgi:MFS family permease